MGHEDHSFGTVVDSIFDGWDRAGDTLRVGDFLVAVEWDVEIDLDYVSTGIFSLRLGFYTASRVVHTRMRTLLPFRSTSWMESLFDKDMLAIGSAVQLRICAMS